VAADEAITKATTLLTIHFMVLSSIDEFQSTEREEAEIVVWLMPT
jgi:hypothetical protein